MSIFTVLVIYLKEEADLIVYRLSAKLLQAFTEFDRRDRIGSIPVEDSKSSFHEKWLYLKSNSKVLN